MILMGISNSLNSIASSLGASSLKDAFSAGTIKKALLGEASQMAELLEGMPQNPSPGDSLRISGRTSILKVDPLFSRPLQVSLPGGFKHLLVDSYQFLAFRGFTLLRNLF